MSHKTRSTTSEPPSTRRHRASPASIPDDSTLPGVVEQYQHYLPIAQQLPAALLRVARIDVSLVLLNAARGVAALVARRDEVAALPGISMDQITSLADIGQALQYAAGCVERYLPTTGETKAMLATASRLRAQLLAKADVLVIDGVIPAATVAGIRKGRGPIDSAGDCIALAALFHEHADQLAGRVMVTPAVIQAANDIGAKLLTALRPDAAKKAPNKELVSAADARDRLWTLFEQTWEQHVWRAGAWLYGRDVELHVPLLGTRVHGKRAAKAATTPAPTVAPEPVAGTAATPMAVAA